MVTLAVVGTATQAITEYQSAKHQTAAIDQQLATTQREIRDSEIGQINERRRAARQEAARIKVAAGQAGLNFGGSIESLLMDSAMQSSLANQRTRQNADAQQRAAASEANAMYSRVQRPTILGTGLRLATSTANAYYGGKSLRIQQDRASRGPE